MTNQEKRICPTCKKPTNWDSANRYKPFCSARCKLIDLGEWVNESRKIPGEPADPDILQEENDPNQD